MYIPIPDGPVYDGSNIFLEFMRKVFDFFELEMNIFGHVFSFWDVFVTLIVVGVIFSFFHFLFWY